MDSAPPSLQRALFWFERGSLCCAVRDRKRSKAQGQRGMRALRRQDRRQLHPRNRLEADLLRLPLLRRRPGIIDSHSRISHFGARRRNAKLVSLRCDHCRANLGLIVERYWHMRFCCRACKEAYQHRLQGDTKIKIARLDVATRRFGPRPITSLTRRLAG